MPTTSKNAILKVAGCNLSCVLFVLYRVCLESLIPSRQILWLYLHQNTTTSFPILAIHDRIPISFTESCKQAVSTPYLEVPGSFLGSEADNHDCGCSSVFPGKQWTNMRDFKLLSQCRWPHLQGQAVEVLLDPEDGTCRLCRNVRNTYTSWHARRVNFSLE